MRRCVFLLVLVAILAGGSGSVSAAVTTAQKKELNAIKVEINKIPALISKKKIEEAEKALTDVETKLDEYVKEEKIQETDATLKGVRQALERQKAALLKAGGKAKVMEEVSFVDKIAPILAEKCIGCHDNDAKGGLRLNTFAGMEKGGANGALLVIGQPQQSHLIARLTTQNAQLRMPKGSDPLPAEDIKKISDWIAAGAKFDAQDKNAPLGKLEKPKEAIQVAKPTGDERVSFIRDIAPGFVVTCQRCHNGNNRSGGLSMVTFEKLMQGGDSGKVIIPGKVDDSKLWVMLSEGDMPRGQARITRKWYNDLKIWIQEGCKYDNPDPRADLAKLIPSEEELKMAELARLTPAQFAERRLAASDEQWTKSFPKTEAKRFDSSEFNLYGDVSEARLKQIDEWANDQLKMFRQMFNAKEQPLFRGKLTIFVFKDRFGYEEFNSTIHGREVPKEVVGHSRITPITQEEAFLALQDVGDSPSENSPGMQLNLMEQLAGAFLGREAKGAMPDWLIRGTGMALGARANLGEDYLKAQRKAAGAVLQTVRLERPDQIFESGTFSPSDVGPVGLTVVEFLLKQGGGGGNFGKFVQRVQAGEKVDTVLKAVYNTDARSLGLAYGTAHIGSTAGKKKK
jgi:hypothetical protein